MIRLTRGWPGSILRLKLLKYYTRAAQFDYAATANLKKYRKKIPGFI